ncbi:MAG: hypothetical protein KME07_01190 [Pegethrix bostrychoides GSE-TBD4-15B]|jgi:N-methylhydantoinase A/oxoprolinase/acetone carboxylase beta subunit|uniref:Uncharacterized protein n=1 Tax=Pegethrix bostrychoides GSE-TBD4-15B TaxID=2839662 RepID=A0A951U2X4_9CYAN|nr:hypothetical protein [Pegethrix bostrychoides GSE-TBD4-15B]
MTTSPSDRLDRIERILEELATSQQQTQQQQQLTQRQLETTRSIVESNAEQQQFIQRQLELTRSIVESNAKAITALGQTVIDDREETAETASRNMVQGRNNEQLIEILISEGQENIRQHQAFTERFDRMLLEIQRIWQRIAG